MHSSHSLTRLARRLLFAGFAPTTLSGSALIALLSGCTLSPESSGSDEQSACERSQKLQDVELYDGSLGVSASFVQRQRRAVGMLRWRDDLAVRYLKEAGNVSGRGWCTGTLIDDDLFLTAGHCLDNEDSPSWTLPREKGGKRLDAEELAREFVVEFRYETAATPGASSPSERVAVVRLEELRYRGLDYAILRLEGHPGRRNRVARIAAHNPKVWDPIAILQHPAAMPMQVGAGAVSAVSAAQISYDAIDTMGGSSGAGILDARGKLVGVHTNGGCTKRGGENYGVTIEALLAASPTLRALVDESRDFFVSDWDGDGRSDLAVLYDGCIYPDADHDELADPQFKQCATDNHGDEYFVGRWTQGQPPTLGFRRGECLYLGNQPDRPLCYGAGSVPFSVSVLDWDGDGRSDLGIRRGNCFDIDTNLDGAPDVRNYCFGNGGGEDEYLAIRWQGSTGDSVAVRRGNTLLVDVKRDGSAIETLVYGDGGNEDQYLVGDWLGTGRQTLAIRHKRICLINHDLDDGTAEEGRVYQDFWSE